MTYQLPPLPYDYAALEPVIDAETMRLHHDGHHRAYVDALNKAIADQPQSQGKTIEDLLRGLGVDGRGVVDRSAGGLGRVLGDQLPLLALLRGPGDLLRGLRADRATGRRGRTLDDRLDLPPHAEQLVERLPQHVLVEVVADPPGERRRGGREHQRAAAQLVHLRVLEQRLGGPVGVRELIPDGGGRPVVDRAFQLQLVVQAVEQLDFLVRFAFEIAGVGVRDLQS